MLACMQVAVVRSAVKLEQEQQFLIAKKLQELTGSKNIKLRPMIDQVRARPKARVSGRVKNTLMRGSG